MPFHPDLHRRRSIRLPGFDYASAGAYFVTLVTEGRECLFGEILDGVMQANESGQICAEEWLRSAELRGEIRLDAWIVMPNHLHGVVFLRDGTTAPGAPGRHPSTATQTETGPRPRSLGALVAGFKSAVTRRLNERRGTPGAPVWQRNYYEHVIRDEAALQAIREYVLGNPGCWAEDRENPAAKQRTAKVPGAWET